MRSTILLSRRKDPDLIALYQKVGNATFSNLIKDSLRVIVREGYRGDTQIPNGLILQGNLEEETIKVNLILTSQKDEDIRQLLSHVLPGELGNFIKQALRFYIGPAAVLSGFMNNDFILTCQANPITVQVFQFGDNEIRKEKKTVKKKSPRKNKPKTSNITTTVTPAIKTDTIPSFSTFSQAQTQTSVACEISEMTMKPQTIGTTESTDGVNEDDEMLALLEGLL